MQEITINQAREITKDWQQRGKAWHFHVLSPDCIFNSQNKRYSLILENRSSDESFVIYSDHEFAKLSQELLKLGYGNNILKAQSGTKIQGEHPNPLLPQIEIFKQQNIAWHHHMLFPDCLFNEHPGKWNIVLEGRGEAQIFNALYDEEPVEDLKQIEIEYFKQIDPTFIVETQEKDNP